MSSFFYSSLCVFDVMVTINIFIYFFHSQYTQAMIHSIQNADGTVSIIQVDPNNQIITLPDGTTAQVQGVATVGYTLKSPLLEVNLGTLTYMF